MDRTCERCGEPIYWRRRTDVRYCSARCRVAANRASKKLPRELTKVDRWVRYSTRKVPLRADNGRPASSMDPASWSSYDMARRSTAGIGIGFVLSEQDDIMVIDIDHCLSADGTLSERARSILDSLPSTFAEVSPSGRGIHVWVRGALDCAGFRRNGIEVYAGRRYATVTNRRFGNAPNTLARVGNLGYLRNF